MAVRLGIYLAGPRISACLPNNYIVPECLTDRANRTVADKHPTSKENVYIKSSRATSPQKIAQNRTTELMFIEPGVKINGAYITVTSCSASTFCRRFIP